ncbi:DUF5063 domain-containing protein [Chryseobacterium wangxinyae]|uniref:DUF5063 domain-containing protein n=1 Tax=Chryseobacterium sp. CY350 TaxID=2997336 RepID=UPI0022709D47|nr:DUF5063 domain-containing protein [Chryseobacterium sp. CY350]MCY0979087.1 DUF5063 domain-containing protein [Chryseobacterium sp. CY350]WBZ97186.1 DUF5063 domain-containing protein [Chryseobacterium sp. CY350]
MKDLIPTINEIIKFGLYPSLSETNKETLLEKNLIKIYSLYFDITYTFDKAKYPDFNKKQFRNVQKNVESNFKDFGFYKIILDIQNIDGLQESALGDAIDDLSDIILDLLEIKWRINNNSLNDGLWYFKFIFHAHTQEHIIGLLNFMKQKNT